MYIVQLQQRGRLQLILVPWHTFVCKIPLTFAVQQLMRWDSKTLFTLAWIQTSTDRPPVYFRPVDPYLFGSAIWTNRGLISKLYSFGSVLFQVQCKWLEPFSNGYESKLRQISLCFVIKWGWTWRWIRFSVKAI